MGDSEWFEWIQANHRTYPGLAQFDIERLVTTLVTERALLRKIVQSACAWDGAWLIDGDRLLLETEWMTLTEEEQTYLTNLIGEGSSE